MSPDLPVQQYASQAALRDPHCPAKNPPARRPSAPRRAGVFRGDKLILLRYGAAILVVVVGHLIARISWQHVPFAPHTVYLAVVVFAALYGGLGPGLMATVLTCLDLDYSFMPPYRSLVVGFDDFLFLGFFLLVATAVSSLEGRRRRAERSLRAAHEKLEARVAQRTAELLRSREQFSLLVNGVSDQAFFMLDREGIIASWNAGAERLLGYCEQEILGQHVARLWPDAYRAGTSPDPAAVAPVDRFDYNDWIVRKDASRFWAWLFLTQVHDETGQPRGRAIAMRDITERRSLERDILEISESERVRIGHDLHDGLGQELSGIAMLSTALAQGLAKDNAAGWAQAESIAELVHESIAHTRALARGLCPVDLEDEGLPAAMAQLAESINRLPGVACGCDAAPELRITKESATHLYRIAQEAINNALRHGRARRLTVRLGTAARQLFLEITDDGIGIGPSNGGGGMGLRLMRYRAKMIRATLHIGPGESGGTAVRCTLDLEGIQSHD